MSAPKHPSSLSPPNYYQGLEDRIRANILPTLTPYLADTSRKHVLEIASGAGVHSKLYSESFPHLDFQPTECDTYMTAECDTTNKDSERVKKAIVLDVTEEEDWKSLGEQVEKEGTFDVVLASNCLHMIPYSVGPQAMFAHFADLVSKDGVFLVYGPFKKDNAFLSESDQKFDAMIRARENGEGFGIRSYEALDRLARQFGWQLVELHNVPLGNFILVFARSQEADDKSVTTTEGAETETTEVESTLEGSGEEAA